MQSMNNSITVTKTYLPDKQKYFNYIEKIFESGWLTNNGPLVQELEERLANYLWVSHLLLVSNGTLALQIIYKVLGLRGNVITTPFSFVATTSSLVWEGFIPKFVDINRDYLTIDETKVEDGINEDTSAILWVHVYWNPCNIEGLEQIAQKKELKLIFDAAHCFDVQYKWTSILNYWDASMLSFHSTKLFHTIEWWAIVFKNKSDLDKARLMINFWISGPEKIEWLGINGKMNEFQAAMGLSILDDIRDNILKRKEICEYYTSKINKNYLSLKWRENTVRNYAYYPIILDSEIKLTNIISKLNEKNIFPRKYFKPSLNKLNYVQLTSMDISEDISNRILCLPLYEWLDPGSLDLIINVVNNE